MLYKIKHNVVQMTYSSLLIPYPYLTKSIPAGAYAYLPMDKMPLKVYYNSSFFPNTVADWNLLPEGLLATVDSLETFKSSVSKVVV